MTRRFLSFRRWFCRAFWASMLVLLVALAIRLVWIAARTETGLETLAMQWRDATWGWIVGAYEPVYTRRPPEQAEYWLAEVDRVLAAHPDDPQLAMGAAIVLDAPSSGYLRGYMTRVSTVPPFDFLGLDDEGIGQAEGAFEKRCNTRCLELAARATRLDPTNVERWRMRAMLPHRQSFFSNHKTPRDSDWLRTLDECARHDPNNALYDYLAACYYWDAAAEIDYSEGEDRLIIKDVDKFRKGIRRFEQGQAKNLLAEGDSGCTAAAEFLSHTLVPEADHQWILLMRLRKFRITTVFFDIWRWQGGRANQRALGGEVEAALTLSRQNLHLIDQYEKGGSSQAHDASTMGWRLATASLMQSYANAPTAAVSDSDKRHIVTLMEEAVLRTRAEIT
ncbi:MAG: hypothetical protein ACYC35_29840 [Pirellulales bacterium]